MKKRIPNILRLIFTPVLIILGGVTISLLTGYEANEQHNVVRVLVWLGLILFCWFFASLILKIIFRDKVDLLNWKTLLAVMALTTLIIFLAGDEDYTFVSSFLVVLGILTPMEYLLSSKKNEDNKNGGICNNLGF